MAHAAANADDVHVQFAGAIEQRLVAVENAAPTNGLKINMEYQRLLWRRNYLEDVVQRMTKMETPVSSAIPITSGRMVPS